MERILNVGCGNDAYGTDFVDFYPSRNGVKKCNIDRDRLPYDDNTFDEVYAKNLLEHLTNVSNFFKEAARVLKRGGRIVVITDNASYWGYAVGRTHLGGYETMHGDKEDRHYSLFTEWHLKNHLRSVGLQTVKTELMSSPAPPHIILKKVINIILRATPFWRMAYSHVKIIGSKG